MAAREPNFTADYLRNILHYAPDTGIFTWLITANSNKALAGSLAGCLHDNGYRYIGIKSRIILASTLAWHYMTGEWPTQIVDHINRQRSDDRWDNLRLVTNSQNQFNKSMSRNNTSGYKGVSWMTCKNGWQAHIHFHRKQKNLGVFANIEDAIRARKHAEELLHGEFAVVDVCSEGSG